MYITNPLQCWDHKAPKAGTVSSELRRKKYCNNRATDDDIKECHDAKDQTKNRPDKTFCALYSEFKVWGANFFAGNKKAETAQACVDKLSKAATGREADVRSDNEKMLDSGLNTGAHVAADASKAAANVTTGRRDGHERGTDGLEHGLAGIR